MSKILGNRRVFRRGAYGTTDVENILCPVGFTASGDAQGNVWCQDPSGARIAATLTPASPATVTGGVAQAGIGVVGWGIVIAGGFWLASVLRKRGAR